MDPTSKIKDAGKKHRSNALYCSWAAYEDNPVEFFNREEVLLYHDINKVCWGKYKDQKVLFAISNELKALYVAFRGSYEDSDWDTNIKVAMKTLDHLPGKCHQGYIERAMMLFPTNIVKLAEENDIQTIVTCGHSLGGAVSTITALRIMQIKHKTKADIFNITFGSPYVGNSELLRHCQKEKIAERFLHYINNLDPIPNILSLGNTATEVLRRAEEKIPDGAKPFYETAKSYLRLLKPFLDGLMAMGSVVGNEKFETISSLYSELTKPEEKPSLQWNINEKDRYVPIGYYLLMTDEKSCWVEAANSEMAKIILGNTFHV